MECQMDSNYIPQCPHLKPNQSSQNFQDITLQGDFLILENELEFTATLSVESEIFDQPEESYEIGKRSFYQTCASRKYTFQSCIQKVQRKPQKRIHR